ncbi:MAG: hypothetical protein ABIG96_00155 [Candidatus Micrarchaeota archaeon]
MEPFEIAKRAWKVNFKGERIIGKRSVQKHGHMLTMVVREPLNGQLKVIFAVGGLVYPEPREMELFKKAAAATDKNGPASGFPGTIATIAVNDHAKLRGAEYKELSFGPVQNSYRLRDKIIPFKTHEKYLGCRPLLMEMMLRKILGPRAEVRVPGTGYTESKAFQRDLQTACDKVGAEIRKGFASYTIVQKKSEE